MKTTKKALLLALCAVLLVVSTVFATLAYLTTEVKVVKNTFTVGEIEITLDEAKVTEYGVEVTGANRVTENTYKLIPGHKYTKDPKVHVQAGSEPCYLFVKVIDEIAAIQDTKTVAKQMEDNSWIEMDGVDNVYYFISTVDASTDAKSYNVFEEFTIKDDADVASYEGKTITVQAYAIQADGFDDAAAAWAAAPATWTVNP